MDILIIDDERPARNRIRHLLEANGMSDLVLSEASSGQEAAAKLSVFYYDLIFLDINLSDSNAFELLQQFPSIAPSVIFVTAYDEHAVAAFEVEAVDYLLKPFSSTRFQQAFDRAIKKMEQRKTSETETYLERIPIKISNKYYFIKTATINYIKASDVYVELYDTSNKKHTCRASLRAMYSSLDPAIFFKINRSTIINLQAIKEVKSEGGGDHVVCMSDGSEFSISRSIKREFFQRLNIR